MISDINISNEIIEEMEEKAPSRTHHPGSAHLVYLFIVGAVFIAFAIVFLFFPRPTFSELEKRDLAKFPDINEYSGKINQYPMDISTWFSDSEPFRDKFLGMSMSLRGAMGFRFGNPEEAISFKAVDASDEAVTGYAGAEEDLTAAGNPLADADAKRAGRGVIVVGTGQNVRALSSFGGTPAMADPFIKMVGEYVKTFPGVNIYALVIPTACEFYLPDRAKTMCKPAKPILDHIQQNLPAGAKLVNAYPFFAAHTNDPIYLRTDHHWSPLGAFYGAKAFAKDANVPFKELDSYDRHVIHNFVGSMYAFSKDIAIKNNPEDFVYYTPKGLNYKSTFITYGTNKNNRATSASAPYETEFFKSYPDGSSSAYLTFMGGDHHLVKVNTGTPSSRKLLIIKDSNGNALPGYLFYSFGEVHVVDFRYFNQNLTNYVKQNGITDILFAFNVFNTVTGTTVNRISELLHQDGSFAAPTSAASKETASKEKPTAPAKEPAKESKKETAKDSGKKPAATKKESAPAKPKADTKTESKPAAKPESKPEPAPQPAAAPSE